MPWSIWAGRWKQCRGIVNETLGRVAGDPLLEFDGRQDRLNGRLQQYGLDDGHRAFTSVGRTLIGKPGSGAS